MQDPAQGNFDRKNRGRFRPGSSTNPLWRSLAFGSPIPDVYREPSSIYVAYCNEPPRWLPKDKEDDPRGFRSGSGEVAAAFELGSVLGRAGLSYEVVRSRNLKSVEILAKTDIMLLVLGSTLSFEHLDDIRRQIWPSSQRFKFDWEETGFDNRGQPQGYGFILDTISGRKFVNLDMQEGKPETQYALVSIIRNDKSQLFVNLAGISTLGTEAAVKLLCNPVTLRQVLEKLAISDLTVPSFELLLEMNINWDIPYLPKIVDYVCPVNAPETVAAATAAS
jgi:hypothetical protein